MNVVSGQSTITWFRLGLIYTLLHSCFLHTAASEFDVGKDLKPKPKIAIIIDDLGYRLKEGRRSINLNFPLTLAIIPSSPHAQKFADEANCHQNKEVLVHMPMTPIANIQWEAGLNQHMSKQEFLLTTELLLAKVPFAIGVNNHGGSQLTQNRERMDWLMSVLGRKQLFFVDSRTTKSSKANLAAAMAAIPFTKRDVFLDNQRDEAAILKQLDRLIELASKHGSAIAIGHPYNETLEVLERRLFDIQKQGYELVGVSQLLHRNDKFAARSGSQKGIF